MFFQEQKTIIKDSSQIRLELWTIVGKAIDIFLFYIIILWEQNWSYKKLWKKYIIKILLCMFKLKICSMNWSNI